MRRFIQFPIRSVRSLGLSDNNKFLRKVLFKDVCDFKLN